MNEDVKKPNKVTLIAVAIGIVMVVLSVFSLISVNAAEVVPSGDLREAEAVIATWDGSTLYAPEPYFTNSLLDSLYPGETVYYGGYAALENSKIRFRYEIHGEEYTSFFPDEVMCAVFASDGTVLDHRYVKNEFSIYDYAFSRGYLGAWSDNLVYVNTDLGYSFADLDVLGISGRVLYFSVYQNQVDHYYAAQISSGTFSIVDSPDSSLYNILSSELSSNISLFSWNSDTREWDLITANASESVLNAYPVDKVLRLQGTSALYFKDGGFTRLEPVYFREDSVPPDPEISPTPTPVGDKVYWIVKGSPVFYGGGSTTIRYYCYVLDVVDFGIPVELSLQGDNALSATLANNSGLGTTWVNPVILHSTTKSEGAVYYFSATSVANPTLYDLGTVLVSSDFDYITSHYSPIPLVNNSGSTMASGINFRYQQLGQIYCFCPYIGKYPSADLLAYPPAIIGSENLTDDYFFNTSSSTYGPSNPITLAYKYALNEELEPEPDPYATPTPTPSPTPTDAPHVIITWPTGTPTPTPFPLDFAVPTLPGGDLNPQTTENILSRGIEQLRLHLNTGLLATAFSYVPPELQFLIWFLVFVLLLLAVVKLILHFGG